MGDTTLTAAAVAGFAVPFVTALVNRAHWGVHVKRAVMFAVSVLGAALVLWATHDPEHWQVVATVLASVIGVAQTVYAVGERAGLFAQLTWLTSGAQSKDKATGAANGRARRADTTTMVNVADAIAEAAEEATAKHAATATAESEAAEMAARLFHEADANSTEEDVAALADRIFTAAGVTA